jgi:hypothetical protein
MTTYYHREQEEHREKTGEDNRWRFLHTGVNSVLFEIGFVVSSKKNNYPIDISSPCGVYISFRFWKQSSRETVLKG